MFASNGRQSGHVLCSWCIFTFAEAIQMHANICEWMQIFFVNSFQMACKWKSIKNGKLLVYVVP